MKRSESLANTLRESPFLKVVLLLGVVLLPTLSTGIKTDDYLAASSVSEEGLHERNQSAVANLFGEVRATISDVMFVKTERYLHSGIGYQPHLDYGEMERTGRVRHDHDHEDEHGSVATIIRSPGLDWRYFIGNLEREVKPWRNPDSHVAHTPGEELLPWYWLAVTANPHNTRAYRIGAFWLMSGEVTERLDEALRFIDDGIRNNPDYFGFYLTQGMILLRMKRHDAALESFVRGSEMGRFQRPEGGFSVENAADLRETDFRSLMRFRALLLEKAERYEESLKAIEEYQSLVPEDRTLNKAKARVEAALRG
jgi:tetratricopeptide (TPR) repeat protein